MKTQIVITTFFLLNLFSSQANAQIIYSQWASPAGHVTTSRSPDFLCTTLTCATISAADNTVDNSLSNYSTVSFPLLSLLNSVTYTMDLSAPVTNGNRGGAFVMATTSLAGLSVLPSIKVDLLNNTTVVGSETHSALLNLSLFSTSGMNLCAAPTGTYNKVRLTISVPVGVSIPVEFRVFYAYGNGNTQCLNSVLPVNLLDFKLMPADNCSVKLEWQSDEETNLDHYTIQSYTTSTGSWKNIAQISARNSHQYFFLDEQINAGLNTYRVTAIDKDGSRKIFPAKSIRLNCNTGQNKIYPSVVSDYFFITSPAAVSGVQITAADMSGRLFSVPFTLQGRMAKVQATTLPDGIYIIRVVASGEIITYKCIVRH